jgi:hypothetical protein
LCAVLQKEIGVKEMAIPQASRRNAKFFCVGFLVLHLFCEQFPVPNFFYAFMNGFRVYGSLLS